MQHDTLCRTPGTESDVDWNEMADRVLSGDRLTTDEACVILDSPDSEVLDLLAATYRVRRNYFGRSVQLYYLMK